jgi:DNA-binding MarR family transcriptional regulator
MGMLLRTPHHAVVTRIHEGLAARGFDDLHPAHLAVFQNIEAEGLRPSQLAAKAQITKQSMGYLVDYLEERGYVRREPDPLDGRAKLVRMTERGWEVMDAAFAIVDELEEEWAAQLGEERFRQLQEGLDELFELLEQSEAHGTRSIRTNLA